MKYCWIPKKIISLIFLSVLFSVSSVFAQTEKKPELVWDTWIYSKNNKYVELNINTKSLHKIGYRLVKKITFRIKFYGKKNKYLGSINFSIPNSELPANKVKIRKWQKHHYRSVSEVRGVATYSYTRIGLQGTASDFKGNIANGSIAPDFKKYTCAVFDAFGNLLPGLVRNRNGSVSPAPGYTWYYSNTPNNFCVKKIPSIFRNPSIFKDPEHF